jgi:hypothetical protein
MKIRLEGNVPAMIESQGMAADLVGDVMEFIDKWLRRFDMKVVENDAMEEPVVVAAGQHNGHGHVSINFHFMKA